MVVVLTISIFVFGLEMSVSSLKIWILILFITFSYHWFATKLFLSQGFSINGFVPVEAFFWLSCCFRLFVCLLIVFDVSLPSG